MAKNHTSDFLAALLADGFEPKGTVVADDKWHPAFYMGEKKKCSGTYSLKICENNFAIGCYFTRKDPDTKFKWHSESEKKLSPEERKKISSQIEAHRRKRENTEKRRHLKISKRITRVYKNLPNAEILPYLKKKRILPHKVKIRKKTGDLIIPLYGGDGTIQTIQKINAKGGKFLFAGGKKKGSYFPMCCRKDDLSLILICEGFSTGASIKEATGLPVIVAIDSGNMKFVSISLAKRYKHSKFIICADNDAFTKNQKGEVWNVGVESAKKASAAIDRATVVCPDFSKLDRVEYEKTQPTDFNDLQNCAGPEEVRSQIIAAVDQDPVLQDGSAGVVEASQISNQRDAGGALQEYRDKHEKDADRISGDFEMNFRVLGYNDGIYYYFPFKERQIIALSAIQHNSFANLFRLDNYYAWMDKFSGHEKISEKKVVMYATNSLMELAKNRGVFKEEDRVRGCGAWIDAGRKVLHCGDFLYVDGVKTKFDQLKSQYTYVAAAKLWHPSLNPLKNQESIVLREICEKLTWENKLSGSLLAGWLVVAPICGALPFRPHIYITGEAESGKSTILDKIIKPVLGKIALRFDGGTTEPAIRQNMGYDARPLIYDEAEKSTQMPAVLELARKASTGATVGKFGQRAMKVRFCACFSAINPPVDKAADESRISFMVLKKNRKLTAAQDYDDLLALIEKTLVPDFSNRLMARTLQNIDALFKNIKVFQRAARKVTKGTRASEVIGSMLAGLYLLSKTDVVTSEFAERWISQRNWTPHALLDDETDPTRLLQFIASCIVGVRHQGQLKEYSIGDMINMAPSDQYIDKQLRYRGIAVKDGVIYIAGRSQYFSKILKETDWSVKWTRMLSNLPGAEQFRSFYFGVGYKTSGTSLPIKFFKEEDACGYQSALELERGESLDEEYEQEIPL